jgi:CRP/FNR family transcriptional regulator, nitrogen oxide reductase regulator
LLELTMNERAPGAADRKLLARVGLFNGLDAGPLAAVIQAATVRRLPPGAVLLEQGDEPRWLYLIVEGRLKIGHMSPDGKPLTLRLLGPGDLVGCAAVFRKLPYPATATAVVDARVLVWGAARFEALMDGYPQLAKNALSVVSGRAEEMLRRVQEMATEPVDQRIARALLRLVRDAGRPVDAGTEIDFALSRQDLAEFAGATLYTVSRTLSAWQQAGIVASGRRHVVVCDLPRLTRLAEGR